MFWDRKCVLLVDFLPQGSTINAGVCCDTLQKFRLTIQNKRRGMLSRVLRWFMTTSVTALLLQCKISIWHLAGNNSIIPLTAHTLRQVIFIRSCIQNPSLLASVSTKTVISKKPLPCALHHRRHHSTMKGYKNWCNAMASASTMVETMSKRSVRYVHQMAIHTVCNIFLSFLNSPLELTFWITYIQ